MLEVIILGSGTCSVSLRRNSAGYCIRHNNTTCLIDTGAGTMRQLLRSGVRLPEIDGIFYTHFHIDHIGELSSILFTMNYDPLYKREKPVKIFGAKGLLRIKEGLESIFNSWVMLPPEKCCFFEIGLEKMEFFEIGSLKVETIPVKHSHSSIAYRFKSKDGKSVVFSGDVVMCDEIIEISKGVDLLILECAYPEEYKVDGHLCPSEAGEIAQKAGVKRLVLTHFYPQCDESDMITPCRKHYNGNIVLAEDFMRFVV